MKNIAIILGVLVVVLLVLFVTNSDIGRSLLSKQITYEVVDRQNPGVEVRIAVISPDYLNEADMVSLGEKLKNDTSSDSKVIIVVFDNKEAALSGKVSRGEMTQEDQSFYDQHYVGQYIKNSDINESQFTIYFDGINRVNQKVIKY